MAILYLIGQNELKYSKSIYVFFLSRELNIFINKDMRVNDQEKYSLKFEYFERFLLVTTEV